MSFEYNTSKKQLVLPEYGRNIQMMVDYIKAVEDRDERNKLAQSIIAIMGNLNPHLRDINDFKHKLWDHLAIIADFELDIDYPYDIPKAEMFRQKPRIVEYGTHNIVFRHYGKAIEMMIEAAITMEDGPEKESLVNVVANHMKKSYLTWNRDTVDDEVILNDLTRISKGKINTEAIKLNEVREPVNQNRPRNQQRSNPRKNTRRK
jgi:Domain of unknown function (DUF4290)